MMATMNVGAMLTDDKLLAAFKMFDKDESGNITVILFMLNFFF